MVYSIEHVRDELPKSALVSLTTESPLRTKSIAFGGDDPDAGIGLPTSSQRLCRFSLARNSSWCTGTNWATSTELGGANIPEANHHSW